MIPALPILMKVPNRNYEVSIAEKWSNVHTGDANITIAVSYSTGSSYHNIQHTVGVSFNIKEYPDLFLNIVHYLNWFYGCKVFVAERIARRF